MEISDPLKALEESFGSGSVGMVSTSPKASRIAAVNSISPVVAGGQNENKHLATSDNQGQACSAPGKSKEQQKAEHLARVAELEKQFAHLPQWQADKLINQALMKGSAPKTFNGWGDL